MQWPLYIYVVYVYVVYVVYVYVVYAVYAVYVVYSTFERLWLLACGLEVTDSNLNFRGTTHNNNFNNNDMFIYQVMRNIKLQTKHMSHIFMQVVNFSKNCNGVCPNSNCCRRNKIVVQCTQVHNTHYTPSDPYPSMFNLLHLRMKQYITETVKAW